MSGTLELVGGLALAAGVLWFVLAPIFRPAAAVAAPVAEDDGEDPADDTSPRTLALRALKEIEFDRATGKLSDADYDALKARYTATALAALRGEPVAAAGVVPAARPAPGPAAVAAVAAPVAGARVCPVHGPRGEAGAEFCPECGRRLAEPGRRYCARCGTALETDAQFCAHCGTRVAA